MTDFFANLNYLLIFEIIGGVLSIAGSEVLSRKNRFAPWGWAIWLCANITMIVFAVCAQHWVFAITQVWFLKTSIAGIRNHLLPHIKASKTGKISYV